jgi:hypothetical protein
MGDNQNIPPCPPEGYFYDVGLVAQPDKLSCWAASMAMLVGYQRQASLTAESLAAEVGMSLRTSYGWDLLEAVKDRYGFRDIPLPSNATLYPSPAQWCGWLGAYGPLWVTIVGAPSHAIIVRGISGDMTPEGTTVEVLNPWRIQPYSDDPIDFDPFNDGMEASQPFPEFAADFGLMDMADYGQWRVLYLPAAP